MEFKGPRGKWKYYKNKRHANRRKVKEAYFSFYWA